MTPILLNTTLLLLVTVVCVLLFRRFALPTVLAYLAVGIALGPHALGLMTNSEQTKHLAEVGIVFLMFTIGLEFSLAQLYAMRRLVLGLGAAQVLGTMIVVSLLCLTLDMSWQAAVAASAVIAMSSTAIVAKLLAERLELQTRHGRQIMGVLLFQDLAAVLLFIVVPELSNQTGTVAKELGVAAIKAAIVFALLLWVGRGALRSWFHLVARSKSPELFVLNVLLVVLGMSLATHLAGLSLALGAFLAGMLLSETEYRYQIEDYITPFRDVLVGVFFIGIGLMLDLSLVANNLLVVLFVALTLVAIKLVIVLGVCAVYGNDRGLALRTALALAPAGEFGFVLLSLAQGTIATDTTQVLLAAMLISIISAPLIVANSDRIVLRLVKAEWMQRALAMHELAVRTMGTERHIIVCGYGRSGQNLVRLLQSEGLRSVALDHDPQRVREAAAAGESVVFGDAERREVLLAAGVQRAAAVVVSFAQSEAALRILSHTRDLAPGVPVVVRTFDDSELQRLQDAGATEVVPEVLEGALMLASHAMLMVGVPLNRVLRRIRETRRARYDLMRGFFPGASDDEPNAPQPRLHSVMLTKEAYATGRVLRDLNLLTMGVEITALRRAKERGVAPSPDLILQDNDVVVLLGEPDKLALAEDCLLRGPQ